MPAELCGATTRSGAPCRWRKDQCRHHQARTDDGSELDGGEKRGLPAGRDLRELGWWLIEQVASGGLGTGQGSVIASTMRVLAALGAPEEDVESESRVIELQARLSMGFPPRNADEWALAERLYDDHALAEFRRWEQLEPRDSGG